MPTGPCNPLIQVSSPSDGRNLPDQPGAKPIAASYHKRCRDAPSFVVWTLATRATRPNEISLEAALCRRLASSIRLP